jgi:hypothetical protein
MCNARNTLDNRRSNLRIATRRQNALNSKRANAYRDGDSWRISIGFRGRMYQLGKYSSEEEANSIRAGAVLLADAIEAREFGTMALSNMAHHFHHPDASVRGHK